MDHRIRSHWLAVLALLGGMSLPVATASAVTPARAIAVLNAQRTANGIPGRITENRAWSAGCVKHMNYLKLNGGVLAHDEVPGRRGYTTLGDEAGNSSVLADPTLASRAFAAGRNPWEEAPIHLMQLLGPELRTTGYADGCMATWPGYVPVPDDAPPTFHTYPGNGVTNVVPYEIARELPVVPGQFVGLPEGTRTGKHLLVFFPRGGSRLSRSGRVTGATLASPSGAVEVRTVDQRTLSAIPQGGILIPVKPLRPRTTYTATVNFAYADQTFDPASGVLTEADRTATHTWSFTTGSPPTSTTGSPPESALVGQVAFGRFRVAGSTVRVALTAKAAAVGERVTLRVSRYRLPCDPDGDGVYACRPRVAERRSQHPTLRSSQILTFKKPGRRQGLTLQLVDGEGEVDEAAFPDARHVSYPR